MSEVDYNGIAQKFAADKLRQSMSFAVTKQPDEEAEINRLAVKHDLPPDAVRYARPLVETKDKLAAINYDEIAQNYKRTASFLADPNNAAIAHDDTERLSALEALHGAMSAPQQRELSISSFFGGIGQSFVTGVKRAGYGATMYAADTVGNEGLKDWAVRKSEQAKFRQELADPELENNALRWSYMIPQNLLQNAPSFAAAALTGGVTAPLAIAGTQSGLTQYGDVRARGGTANEALASGALVGGIEAATELLPMGVLVNKLGKEGFKKFLAEYALKDLSGELLATTLQGAVDTAIANPDRTWGDYFKELPSDLLDTAVVSAGSSGIIGTANAVAYKIDQKKNMAEGAKQAADMFARFNTIIEASNLKRRSPETLKAFIESVSDDNGIDTVYIDPNALAQSGVDMTPIYEALPAHIVDHAMTTSADLAIKLQDIMTMPEGYWKALEPLVKTDPQGMSRQEADAFIANEGEDFQKDFEKAAAARQDKDAFDQSRQTVEDAILEQLTKANRFTADVNQPYAKLFASGISVLAARSGKTPDALYRELNPQIVAEGTQQGRYVDKNRVTPYDMTMEDREMVIGAHRNVSEILDFLKKPKKAAKKETLIDFLISKGGLVDQSGELRAMDADKTKKLVAKDGGLTLDDAALLATEAGFIKGDGNAERMDIDQFLELLRRDLSKRDVVADYSDAGEMSANDQAADLEATLYAAGIEYSGRDNADVIRDMMSAGLLSDDVFNQAAYHGSPYRFKRFDLSKIGTGEGAQAYGWGIYLAEQKAVGEDYMKALQEIGDIFEIDGKRVSIKDITGTDKLALQYIKREMTNEDISNELEDGNISKTAIKNVLSFVDGLRKRGARFIETKEGGQLYKVEIPDADIEKMLDWDKPLSEQSAFVKDALKKALGDRYVGSLQADFLYKKELQGFLADELGFERSPKSASEYLNSLGIVGIKYLDGSSRSEGEGTRNFVVFDQDLLDKISDSIETLYQGQRGSYNPATNVIAILNAADLTTFLHESGHFFLHTMGQLATGPQASADIRADMDGIMKWFGVESFETWQGMTLDQQRPYHEQFARGFEAYLMEGRAPSIEMRGVFQRFAAWLMNIYRSFKSLNVTLNADIRGVFDRMLATADQIAEAEAVRNMGGLFNTAQESGMTDEEFKAYRDEAVQASLDAQEYLRTRAMKDMRWLSQTQSGALKEAQKEVAAKRKALRDEVANEVNLEPVNQVRQFLRFGDETGTQHRMDIDATKEMLGEDFDKLPNKYGKFGMFGKDGLHPEVVAALHGYGSGQEMLTDLVNQENAKDKIDRLTEQRLLERYGDISSQEALDRITAEAVLNEARGRMITAELNAVRKALGRGKVLIEAAKQYAQTAIGGLKIRDVKPSLYEKAQIKEAKAAEESLKAGKTEETAVHKRNQLVNFYMAKQAFEAQKDVEKAVAYFGKFSREGTRKNLTFDHLEQIDALLDRFDFRKSTSLKAIDRRTSLADWVDRQRDSGLEPDVPDYLLNEANRKHYKNMTVDEIRGLRDTIRQIEHISRLKNKLLTLKEQREFNELVTGLRSSITENAKGKLADNRTQASRAWQAIDLFKGFIFSHRKLASLIKELDGFKDGGPVWDVFVRSMNESGNKETEMRSKATADLMDVIKPLVQSNVFRDSKTFFPSINMSLNKEEAIGIALNMGNEGNLQRLLDGEGWAREQIEPVLGSLSKQEMDAVQQIWDFFETFRPEIAAKEKRLYGKEPEWVEPLPVQTKHGAYKGGYFPIKYDARRSEYARNMEEAEEAKRQMQASFTSATTRRSFVKKRADSVKGRPLLYTMDAVFSGVNDVIHDLAWHEWLIDANKLIRAIDGTVNEHYGSQFVKQIRQAVDDIARGEYGSTTALDGVLSHIRSGAVIAGLGVNAMNAAINLTGITQSFVRVGPRWVLSGLNEWAKSPMSLVGRIYEKSSFMKNRGQTFMREVNEVRSVVRGKSKVRAKIDAFMFYPMYMTQIAVDTPTWWGAYQRYLFETGNEAKAVAMADQAVIDAQGSGMVKDLSAIQRGGAIQKLFTTFYGYFNSTYNLAVEKTKATDFSNPASVVNLAGNYLMLFTVPAVLTEIVFMAMKDDEPEDAAEILKRLAGAQASFLMGQLVGLREMSFSVQKMFDGQKYVSAYNGPAGLRFFAAADKLFTQAGQGEVDKALVKSLVTVGGIALHLPATQINRTIDGIVALSEGRTSNPAALLTGGPLK